MAKIKKRSTRSWEYLEAALADELSDAAAHYAAGRRALALEIAERVVRAVSYQPELVGR